MEYNDYLTDNYRIAQSKLGISSVLREQMLVIGAKSWTEMSNSEREKLIKALRKLWSKKSKEEK